MVQTMYSYDAEKILLALLQFTAEQMQEFLNHEIVQEKLDVELFRRLGLLDGDPHQKEL